MSTKYEDIPLPFGKHKGKLICDIPSLYLQWLLDQDWFVRDHPKMEEMIKMELDYRKKWEVEPDA